MRSALFALTVFASGCVFIFDEDDDEDLCHFREGDGPLPIAPAPLRDPGDLSCDFHGGGCNPECGPCPAVAAALTPPTPPTPPIPSWPHCGHICETLSESACSADPGCRVVKDAMCSVGNIDCFTDFIGCFPIDTAPDASVDCSTADAWDCSRSASCTAYHSVTVCPDDRECDRPFELCMPEGQSPGQCEGEVICRAEPPVCDQGKVPGIEDGCYTGACIPHYLCGPTL